MVNAHQGYKLPTAFDEMCLDLVFARMVFERKSVERVDPLCSMELQNGKFDGGLPKHFAIKQNAPEAPQTPNVRRVNFPKPVYPCRLCEIGSSITALCRCSYQSLGVKFVRGTQFVCERQQILSLSFPASQVRHQYQ
jgi:hypothetical protein